MKESGPILIEPGSLALPEGITTPEEAQDFLRGHGVRNVLAQFVDIHGAPKTKAIPVFHLPELLSEGAGFAGFATWGLGMGPEDPDFEAVGELPTLTLLPWQPGYASIICSGHVRGAPWPFDTRNILQGQIRRLQERGLTLNTGIEPEFMLLRRGEDGEVAPADPTDSLRKPCYDYKLLSRSREFLDRLMGSLQAIGIDVLRADHEDANGQFEVNTAFSDALESADRMILIRMAVTEIAHEMGEIGTFMPKPIAGRTGNGLHLHMSLSDSEGNNLFQDPEDERGLGLSPMAYHFIGGLMDHAEALCAFLAPTVNSYKRLACSWSRSGAAWVPPFNVFGGDNRSAMLRVTGVRVENRLPDGAANPYLATAAHIVAGLDGIDRELEPEDPCHRNLFQQAPAEAMEQGIRLVPQSLREALQALRSDSLFAEQLGADFLEEYLRIKEEEWQESMQNISAWELDRYLQYP